MDYLISFGLSNGDYNHKLLSYLDNDILSRVVLTDFQIDHFSHRLNWDIMSSHEIPGRSMVKYKHLIDWRIFLTNGARKEINALVQLDDILSLHADIFDNVRIRYLYYTNDFLLVFPQYVDWDWAAEHIKLSDYTLLKYWNRMNVNIISKYQQLSESVVSEKKFSINWKVAKQTILSDVHLAELVNLLNFNIVCKNQILSEDYIEKYFIADSSKIVKLSNRKKLTTLNISFDSLKLVSKYQQLSEGFIKKYITILDMSIISKYQNMSIDFIRDNIDNLSCIDLYNNEHYNKPDTIQISKTSTERWFIIDAPPYVLCYDTINIIV
jgi:hypothetical protein